MKIPRQRKQGFMNSQAASGPRRAKGEHGWQRRSSWGVGFDSQQLLVHLLNSHSMSDLHRSAISARLAKLPPFLPTAQDEDDDEMVDTIGDLPMPGSGIGPPAMQVMIFIGVAPMFIQN